MFLERRVSVSRKTNITSYFVQSNTLFGSTGYITKALSFRKGTMSQMQIAWQCYDELVLLQIVSLVIMTFSLLQTQLFRLKSGNSCDSKLKCSLFIIQPIVTTENIIMIVATNSVTRPPPILDCIFLPLKKKPPV